MQEWKTSVCRLRQNGNMHHEVASLELLILGEDHTFAMAMVALLQTTNL